MRGLPPEQRIERRRAQHRAVDAARRQKENEAIERLQRLLKERQQQGRAEGTGVEGEVADEDTAETVGDESTESVEGSVSGGSDGGSKKVGRLTVLESSIALIQQLSARCQRMEEACNAKDVQLNRVSSHLHSVAASIAQQATSASSFDDDAAADGYFASQSYPSPSSSHHRPPTHR